MGSPPPFTSAEQGQSLAPGLLLEHGAGAKLRGLPPEERFALTWFHAHRTLVIDQFPGGIDGSPEAAPDRGKAVPLPRLEETDQSLAGRRRTCGISLFGIGDQTLEVEVERFLPEGPASHRAGLLFEAVVVLEREVEQAPGMPRF